MNSRRLAVTVSLCMGTFVTVTLLWLLGGSGAPLTVGAALSVAGVSETGSGDTLVTSGPFDAMLLHQEVITKSCQAETACTLVYTDARGIPTVIQLPAGAVSETLTLVYTPTEKVVPPFGLLFAGRAFSLEAYRDGAMLAGFAFEKPVTVTVHYTETDVAGLREDTLQLRYRSGSAWVDAASTCSPPSNYERRPTENWFALPICHLSLFAALGYAAEHRVFLPVVRREATPPEPPTRFARWRSADGGFDGWQRDGVRLAADGALELDPATPHSGSDTPGGYYGRNFYNGGSFLVGETLGPVVETPVSFTQAIASWNADTPVGTWIETQIQAKLGDRWTKWYNLGVWAADDSTIERHSVKLQGDDDGDVAVDTLIVTNDTEPLNAYRLKLRLFSEDGVTVPKVRNASLTFSDTPTTPDALAPGNPELWKRVLPVPECSQMVYPDGGRVWCSPTSTSMVLAYWTQDSGPCEPRVRAAVEGVYDWLYDGHGNWPFNTAYAATHELEGYVARFTSFAQAEEWIAAGVPVVVSLAWGLGELTGAPLPSSNGHLMVLVGFDAGGNPVVNDPAMPTDDSVQRSYIREEFETLWLKHTSGTVYLIYPSHWVVPDL